jgi:hypothetical protein
MVRLHALELPGQVSQITKWASRSTSPVAGRSCRELHQHLAQMLVLTGLELMPIPMVSKNMVVALPVRALVLPAAAPHAVLLAMKLGTGR